MATHTEVETSGGVATIRFVSDGKVNALSSQTWQSLDEHVRDLAGRDEIRVWIFTGSGKTFIAGADIKELSSLEGADDARRLSKLGQRVLDDIAGAPAVSIAAINGAALGGGCELALACDLRLMADGAIIGQPEVKLGVIPGWGGTQRLARAIGVTRAKQMILTGEPVDASQAEAIGLVNGVVDGESLMASANELAQQVLACGPEAVQAAKEAIDWAAGARLSEGLDAEAGVFSTCFTRPEAREGLAAFLDKRRPSWLNAD